jgi:anaerobic magnesium-protoporphyrin IX monomethyl ester cyclase
MRWYSNIGRRVWFYEIWQWLFHDCRTRLGPTVAEFLSGGWTSAHKGRPRLDAPRQNWEHPADPDATQTPTVEPIETEAVAVDS